MKTLQNVFTQTSIFHFLLCTLPDTSNYYIWLIASITAKFVSQSDESVETLGWQFSE